VIAFFSPPPEPRSQVLDQRPEGWAPQAFDPTLDGDALSWLGFEHGEPDEPLLDWPRPRGWMPGLPRRQAGHHRAPAPAA
jgi:hypothetical protein